MEGNTEAVDIKALKESIKVMKGNTPEWPKVKPNWSAGRKIAAFVAWSELSQAHTPPELAVYQAVELALTEPQRVGMWLDGELVRWTTQAENQIRRIDEEATEKARAKWQIKHAKELALIDGLKAQISELEAQLDYIKRRTGESSPSKEEELKELREELKELRKITPPKAKLTASPILFLDADGDPEIYSALFGEVAYHKGEVTDAEGIEITQVTQSWHRKRIGKTGSAGQLALLAQQMGGAGIIVPMGDEKRADEIRKREELTEADQAELARLEPLLLERRVRACGVTATMHFNAVAGMNSFERLESGIVAGRTEPPAHEVELLARALWPNAGLQLTGSYERQRARLTMANGSERWTEINGHPDNRVARVLSQIRDRGLQQCLGRWRYIHPIEGRSTQRQIVYIGTIPLEMPIARTATEREILPPVVAGEIAERTGQAAVIPTGQKVAADLLGVSKQAVAKREGWETLNKGQPSLKRDYLLKEGCPLSSGIPVTYRMEGKSGSPSTAVAYSSDAVVVKAGLQAITRANLKEFNFTIEALTAPAPITINYRPPSGVKTYDWIGIAAQQTAYTLANMGNTLQGGLLLEGLRRTAHDVELWQMIAEEGLALHPVMAR